MSDVNSVSGGGAGSALSQAVSSSGQQLNQQDFLKLMIEQFKAQDPTKPMDNSQFVGQMAQFSQITATQQMQSSFDSLSTSLQSDQVLRASSLIGRDVLVPSTAGTLGDAGMDGAVNVPDGGGHVTLQITGANGDVVRTIDMGGRDAGLAQFHWDGTDDDGDPVPAGTYAMNAANGDNPLDTYARGAVGGVGFAGTEAGTYVQVGGVGGVLLNQIAQIL